MSIKGILTKHLTNFDILLIGRKMVDENVINN